VYNDRRRERRLLQNAVCIWFKEINTL
jgi:hypothetical protein